MLPQRLMLLLLVFPRLMCLEVLRREWESLTRRLGTEQHQHSGSNPSGTCWVLGLVLPWVEW